MADDGMIDTVGTRVGKHRLEITGRTGNDQVFLNYLHHMKQQPENDPDPNTRLGRHMLIIAWVAGLGLLALFFSGVLERQYNPNQSVKTSISETGGREIVLQRNHQGHYVVRGTINGQPVTFLLDTGATVVSIPEVVATRLGLARGASSYARTANGVIQVYATSVDEIGIGEIRMRNIRAQINPHMRHEEVLLGMSFLKNLEMTQRGDTLTLRY